MFEPMFSSNVQDIVDKLIELDLDTNRETCKPVKRKCLPPYIQVRAEEPSQTSSFLLCQKVRLPRNGLKRMQLKVVENR